MSVTSNVEVGAQLCALGKKYADWDDPISKQLCECFGWLEQGAGASYQAHFYEVTEFVKKILDDFARPGTVVENPMLDGKYLWSRSVLDSWAKLGEDSPFDLKPIEATVHTFAVEVISVLRLPQTKHAGILLGQLSSEWVTLIKQRADAYSKAPCAMDLKKLKERSQSKMAEIEKRVMGAQEVHQAQEERRRKEHQEALLRAKEAADKGEKLLKQTAQTSKELLEMTAKAKGFEASIASLQAEISKYQKMVDLINRLRASGHIL